jgi:signal transduction histidine kinase
MSPSKPVKPQDSAAVEYWRVFRELPMACLLFEANEPEFTIVDMNRARELQGNTTREQHIGRSLPKAFPLAPGQYEGVDAEKMLMTIRKAIKTGTPTDIKFRVRNKAPKSGAVHIQRTFIPIKNDAGTVTHLVAITQDTTEERGKMRRVFETEGRLEAALATGKVGSWLWNLETDTIIADAIIAKMMGVPVKQAARGVPISHFTDMVHKDDRKRVTTAIREAIKKRGRFETEYRINNASGKVQWVIARAQIQERGDELIFPGVLMDITERHNLQVQIKLAQEQDRLNRQAAKVLHKRNEELEAIGRSKDEFVALASHQLRTPATAVKQYLGMVLQGYVGDITDLQAEMLSKAFESNERQIQVINQILNAARVDTGRLVMTEAPLDMCTLIRGIVTDMKSQFDAHAHKLHLSLPKNPVQVKGDLGYLRMAIENIINNALAYTPDGGEIGVRLRVVDKVCKLLISDTGVGIRKADLSKLFIKFSRIHNPLSVQAGGSGIGLYLSAEIMRLHGGAVSADSKINQGTTFAISLPMAQNTT